MKHAALLTGVMILLLLFAGCAAAEDSGTCGWNLTWSLTDSGVLTVSGWGEMTSYDREEPPWASSRVRELILEPGITSIGAYAFEGCSHLRSITIPYTVERIESHAFSGCRQVEEICFSEGLESIESYAFFDLYRLKDITLPEGLINIGDYAFGGCSALKSVYIPESVTVIGENIFSWDDTRNLVVRVMEDSVAELYCLENDLNPALPGQEPPKLTVEWPEAFSKQFPGYVARDQLHIMKKTEQFRDFALEPPNAKAEDEAVYLAETPEGALVLLCGTLREASGWTIVESAPLPAESVISNSDDMDRIDLGFAYCTVRRYHDDVWGIHSTGWREMAVGPRWIGGFGSLTRIFGIHPWGDLTTVDWISLDDSYEGLLQSLDISAMAMPAHGTRQDRTPIYPSPDDSGEPIAELFGEIMLYVVEKQDGWTRVCLGPEDGIRWKLDGWIPTDQLVFGSDPGAELESGSMYLLSATKPELTLITPLSVETFPASEYDFETWLLLGEKTMDGQDCWLLYDCYTEKIGFIAKDSFRVD